MYYNAQAWMQWSSKDNRIFSLFEKDSRNFTFDTSTQMTVTSPEGMIPGQIRRPNWQHKRTFHFRNFPVCETCPDRDRGFLSIGALCYNYSEQSSMTVFWRGKKRKQGRWPSKPYRLPYQCLETKIMEKFCPLSYKKDITCHWNFTCSNYKEAGVTSLKKPSGN